MTDFTPHNEKHQWIAVGYMVEYTNDDVADICSCNPQDFGQEAVTISNEQQCANARLIAQAPNMLAVLEGLAEYHGPGTCPDDLFEAMNDVIHRAKGTI